MKKEKKVFTYYVQNPIYITGTSSDASIPILQGNMWLKALMRDTYAKKYGFRALSEADLCDIGCENCMICINDILDIDEE